MDSAVYEIALPVLNEENRLEKGVRGILSFFLEHGIKNCAIAIVDNGSTDRTEIVSRSLVEEFPETVKYIQVPRRGVGLALQTAWMQSEAKIVGYMDIDLSTDLRHVVEVMERFNKPETCIVAGSRLMKGSLVENRTSLRSFTSRVFNLMLKIFLSTKISDGMCGFKFLRKESALDIIQSETTYEGWFFCTEILVKAEWKNFRIEELPIHWIDDSDSKVKIGRLTVTYLNEMIRLAREKKDWCARFAR